MSNPFWTLVSGPAAVALYQWNASGSQLNVATKSADSVAQTQQVLNDLLIPVAVGYGGAYAVARFTGAVPLVAAAAGGVASYLYYRNIKKDDKWLRKEEGSVEADAKAAAAWVANKF